MTILSPSMTDSSIGTGKVKVGVIGTGNISKAYLKHATDFDSMEIIACADIVPEVAEAKAEEFGIKAMPVDALLADPSIELVINLTLPQFHAQVNTDILNAGKHAYCEKPFATSREEAQAVLDLAEEKGLLVGCAPDTFLGGSHQTCRKLVDDGWIGEPIAGTAFMMGAGHESWHPNAGFYYLKGGGPVLDMGPYYITALVNMLGPVAEVCSMARRSGERIATAEPIKGQRLPVEVDTHTAGTLRFENGAIITMVMSFDVQAHQHSRIELYGTEGSLMVPDPNGFGGQIEAQRAGKGRDFKENPTLHGYTENFRSVGAADMAKAIRSGRAHRVSANLANHVLDVMLTLEEASHASQTLQVKSTCERPAMLPLGLRDGELD